MEYFLLGVLLGMAFHYAVCSYSGCVTGCDCNCNKWKGLK